MKKFYKLACMAVICLTSDVLQAQTVVTIPSGNTATTVTNTTIHRKPLGSLRAYERTALKYTNTEIGMLGTITDIGFYCDTVNLAAKTAVKIYLKEVPDSTFTANTVAVEETGATLVYSDTIYAASFIKGNWVTVTLTTPFLHATTNNIKVIVETNNTGFTFGSDNPTALAKGFRAFTVAGSRMEYWQSPNGSGTAPAGNGTLVNGTRTNIQLTITPLPACTAPPTAGTTVPSATTVCSGGPVTFTLNGNSTGTGLTYQWISSPNGTTWSNIPGATNTAYTATVSVVTYYACVLTCSAQTDTSTKIQIAINPFFMCYCTGGLGGNCATTAIDSIGIATTTLANGLTGCSAGNYTAYPAAGNTTASLNQGQSYTFKTKFTGNTKSSVWIDYNQNGIFETSEWAQICLTSVAGTVVTSAVNIPSGALLGLTGMRIRSRSNAGQNDSTSACANFGTGETEDYRVTIAAGSPCTSPPTAGNTVATPTTVCAGGTVNLSLNGNSTGLGQTYQWQSSPDGLTWSNIPGATNTVCTVTVSAVTYYSCVLTCSGLSSTSTTVMVNINPFYNCYCTTGLGGNCATTAIDSVSIQTTTLANGLTGCSAGNYTSYPAAGNTTATLTQGITYTLSTKFTGNTSSGAWIDYNQNGIFETTEWTRICYTSVAGTVYSASLTVPFASLLGQTGMRVRSRSNAGVNDSTSACSNFGTGEVEDYMITIIAGTSCTAPPIAGASVATPTAACANSVINLSLTGNSSGSGQTYQWQSSPDGLTWTPIGGATQPTATTSIGVATTYYSCILTCSGQSSTSSTATVTVNPFYNCYCVTGIGGGCAQTTIDSVAIQTTTLDNGPTGCSVGNYTNYPAAGNTTATLITGNTYSLSTVLTGTTVSNCSMWIDYNQNGTFDATPVEYTQVCTACPTSANINAAFTVPMSAVVGLTGMRVRSRSNAAQNDSSSSCSAFGSGETEDYLITITGTTGIKNTTATQMYVFPNPTNGIVNIGLSLPSASKVNYQVTTMTGEIVYSEQTGLVSGTFSKSFDLSGFAKGIYFIRVITDKEIVMKKIILQ